MPLPNVKPGDLIRAADWNALVEAFNLLDRRVSDLEGGVTKKSPQITRVLPTGVLTAGDTINIFGSNFDFVRGGQSVLFGATRATNFAVGSSDNLLIVQIPDPVDGATASGAPVTMTVANLVGFTTWGLTIKSKPVQVGGGFEFGFINSDPTTPAANQPIQYNFRLASLSNADLNVLITPNLQFPGAAAGPVEVHDSDGQLRADNTIPLTAGAAKIIGIKVTSVPNVPDGTTFSLSVAASAPGAPTVTQSVPPQTVGQAGEQPDPTITNLTFNQVMEGTATFTQPSPGDNIDGILTIPGATAVKVTIALDTTFANIPAGSTFHYVPSATIVSGAGWTSAPNPIVTPTQYDIPAPGAQKFPGYDINTPANNSSAIIRFTLTRQGLATNNKRFVTFRVQRS